MTGHDIDDDTARALRHDDTARALRHDDAARALRHDDAARALWRRVRPGAGVAAHPDCMEIAAFLDGRADAATRARIEAWLAQDPGAAEELVALAAAAAAAREAAPAPAPAGAGSGALARLLHAVLRPAPALAAVATVAGLWVGYGLGSDLYETDAAVAEALGSALVAGPDAGDGL